jgi:hypothetical protein
MLKCIYVNISIYVNITEVFHVVPMHNLNNKKMKAE